MCLQIILAQNNCIFVTKEKELKWAFGGGGGGAGRGAERGVRKLYIFKLKIKIIKIIFFIKNL